MFLFDDGARWQKVPGWFASKQVEEARRRVRDHFRLDADVRAQTDIPPVWKMAPGKDVIAVLAEISGGRCAFCEQVRGDLAPYRFRPPAHARPGDGPDDDRSYLWRAFHWGNFYPICPDCRPANMSFFPVYGARETAPDPNSDLIYSGDGHRSPDERARLYAPGEMDVPTRGFLMRVDGALSAENSRAEATIAHFRLNRLDLVAARQEVAEGEMTRMFNAAVALSGNPAQWITTHLDAPFGGAIYLLHHRIMTLVRADLRTSGSLSPARIGRTVRGWDGKPGFPDALLDALDAIKAEDAALKEAFEDGVAAAEDISTLLSTAFSPSFSLDETPASAPLLPDDPDHARIASVTIHDFKSLEDIAFALPDALPPDEAEILTSDSVEPPSAPCLLILGENATGKSSILEGIALACVSDDLRDALRLGPVGLTARRITLNPEYMGATALDPREFARVTVEFHPGAAPPRVLGMEVRHAEAEERDDGGFAPFGDTGPARPMVFAYGPNRLYGRTRRPDHTRFIDTLFDSALHVSNPEAWLISLADRKDGALDQIAAALRHIIRIDGEFGTIEIAPDPEDGRSRVWINLIRHLPDGGERTLRQRLAYASSGYRAVLALICDVFARLLAQDMTPYEARLSRAVILIDEIEAHLHPRWKLQIIDGLRKALPRATFILTSHDPLCVRGMRAGEVMMLNRHMAAEGPIPEKVERIGDFGAFERMTVEQLLTSDMFQLASVDDPKAEARYARIADLIAARDDGAPLSGEDAKTLSAFNAEIVEGMPTGVTEITNLVQRAVSDYMKERRAADAAARSEARVKAETAVKDFLRELLA